MRGKSSAHAEIWVVVLDASNWPDDGASLALECTS